MQAQRSLTLPPAATAPWARPRAALANLGQRLRDPTARPALLWRSLWAPYWSWSDAPPPALPRRAIPAPAELGLAGQAVVSGIDRMRRRLWLAHAAAAVCRGAWLGLAFAALLMLLDVAGGPVFDPRPAFVVGGALLLAGVVLAALSKPSRAATARMLDRTFGLHERLGTALDDLGLGVPDPGDRAPIVYLQMADAANAIAALRNDRRLRPAIPVREVVLIVICALLLSTLAFLRGLGGALPELASARVPPFTPAIERPAEPEPSAAALEAAEMAPTIQEVLERSDRSAQARRDLQALAAALADHALTRPASEEIARGDYGEAGERLREAATQTDDLSLGARDGLAGDLDRAAETMRPETNGLQEATRDAASGLRQGDEPARTGLRDLADAVEQAGADVVPQGELASQMRSAQQAAAQRGDSGSQSTGSPLDGDPGNASSSAGSSGDPGSGVDAQAASGADGQQRATSSQSGSDPGSGIDGEAAPGEGGSASVPGEADQPGAGENAAAGNNARPGSEPGGQEGEGDSASAEQGGGAGTGEAGDESGERAPSSATNLQVDVGEAAADPNVSPGSGAEADAAALEGANQRVALPTGSGQEGVQTASDGGSALRGAGAGVTAGSGFATQGDVAEAGPDSNRVPPQHRGTVERFFSSGSAE
jgi:hypothetical protein